VLYIVSHAPARGAPGLAGLVAALGITAGCFVHIAAAAAGRRERADCGLGRPHLAVLKWLGAAYLLYMGLSMLHAPPAGAGNAWLGDS
jgi:threonine/homoserine/homoserine lactone efflux protein